MLTLSQLLSPYNFTMLSWEEVEKHASKDSCWVVVKGQAYDLTGFLNDHPGGAKSILRWAGKDGTEEYEAIHPTGTLEKTLSSGKVKSKSRTINNIDSSPAIGDG